jgi:pimeloyl-ACP methyl ester carboxylesterase
LDNVRFYGKPPYKIGVIHGGPGAWGTVAAIARELSKDCGVIEPLQTEYSIAKLLSEMDGVITGSCRVPITLLGHSWGAWLVSIYAAHYPERVKRVILVGSGPFEEVYVDDINHFRMEHLSEPERIEYARLLEKLTFPQVSGKDNLMKRLGELVHQTDNYCPFEIQTDRDDGLPLDGNIYDAIWTEASQLRASGELLRLAAQITCPVVVIHGELDPHPLNGVKQPLEKCLKDLTVYPLQRCGHEPWKEKYASDQFYSILRRELTKS